MEVRMWRKLRKWFVHVTRSAADKQTWHIDLAVVTGAYVGPKRKADVGVSNIAQQMSNCSMLEVLMSVTKATLPLLREAFETEYSHNCILDHFSLAELTLFLKNGNVSCYFGKIDFGFGALCALREVGCQILLQWSCVCHILTFVTADSLNYASTRCSSFDINLHYENVGRSLSDFVLIVAVPLAELGRHACCRESVCVN